MNVAVVYCYPMVNMNKHRPLAEKFARTYRQFPPGSPCQLYVGCTGGNPLTSDRNLFEGIPCQFVSTDNDGWDIGLYQWASENISCDLMVCLGAYCHFYIPGWLARMASAFLDRGPALYGCWGYNYPNWHIRTTAFWFPPALLQSYPHRTTSARPSRYAFEHGGVSFTRWVLSAGMEANIVSWRGIWDQPEWGKARMGIGDCLLLDQFTNQGDTHR